MTYKRKREKFKWTEEAERVFNDIKRLLINPPVLKAPIPDGLFRLESDTSREGVGGTLLQKQGDEWVVIGYHSKRLPKSAKNFGVTELELTGFCKVQPRCASLGYLFHNMASHTEATPTREGI